MPLNWHETTNLVLTGAAALGAILTAYATLRIWRTSRRSYLIANPTVSHSRILTGQNSNEPYSVTFSIDSAHATAWGISSVTAYPIWRPLISEVGSIVLDATGDESYWIAENWRRRIKLDPLAESRRILIHHDCPEFVRLDFKLAMKSSPRETSRFPMRMKIKA